MLTSAGLVAPQLQPVIVTFGRLVTLASAQNPTLLCTAACHAVQSTRPGGVWSDQALLWDGGDQGGGGSGGRCTHCSQEGRQATHGRLAVASCSPRCDVWTCQQYLQTRHAAGLILTTWQVDVMKTATGCVAAVLACACCFMLQVTLVLVAMMHT